MILGVLKAAFLIEAIANKEKSHNLSFCEAPKKCPGFLPCLAQIIVRRFNYKG
ncbi:MULTISPECIES: hypothetical protein [unclassified Okeania]|uniref:hypothetical protein n=1 Tax=unclassified Okeania TaxID=2634635 RepID=UPI0013BE489C|nr:MULTISPECIES: hypothetical protein [unclassified Okeania]NES76873.1 hypothetical protein [Okeania sp. SIO1H4]NET20501.1 hypothetical protein [Okeania sp. SIO1H5]NET93669.1 hypothetical protein [Okeania sp. SIO1H2]